MMGIKKLNTIIEQLKKESDPIASLDSRLDALQKQDKKQSSGSVVRDSLERILNQRKKAVRKKRVSVK